VLCPDLEEMETVTRCLGCTMSYVTFGEIAGRHGHHDHIVWNGYYRTTGKRFVVCLLLYIRNVPKLFVSVYHPKIRF